MELPPTISTFGPTVSHFCKASARRCEVHGSHGGKGRKPTIYGLQKLVALCNE
jgi:hypothetical protein